MRMEGREWGRGGWEEEELISKGEEEDRSQGSR